MVTNKADNLINELTKKALRLPHQLVEVEAIGVSGSYARNTADESSDIDICVFTVGEIPIPEIRKKAYTNSGFEDVIYFDIDFETSRGDGFRINNTRCDFNWMNTLRVRSFLKRLETDFDIPEYLPGGLKQVIEIYDPNSTISELKGLIPEYPDERARYRIKKAVEEIYFSFYELGWLEKAVYREDSLLFLKHKYEALDLLVRALFAFNKEWLADEKGLIKRIHSFKYIPERIAARMNAIIMHQHDCQDLGSAYNNLKNLLSDTVDLIHERYPNLDLPLEWE